MMGTRGSTTRGTATTSPTTFRLHTKDLDPGRTMSPGTMNGYSYCLGNPVNGGDPSDLWVPDIFDTIWDKWDDAVTGLVVNHAPGLASGIGDMMLALDFVNFADSYVRGIKAVRACDQETAPVRESARTVRSNLTSRAAPIRAARRTSTTTARAPTSSPRPTAKVAAYKAHWLGVVAGPPHSW